MNSSVRRGLVLLLGFALVAAACGDDDTTATQAAEPPATAAPATTATTAAAPTSQAPTTQATTTTTTTTTTTEPAKGTVTTVEIALTGGRSAVPLEGFANSHGFSLGAATITAPGPSLSVNVGDEVTLTLTNEHPFALQHNFAVVADIDDLLGVLWESKTVAINIGESTSVTFTPDEAGSYFYICTIREHRNTGMWGEFTVEG